MSESTRSKRRLSRKEAVNLLVEYGEAYATGSKERGLPDNEQTELVELIERALTHLTGREPEPDDVARTLPY